MDRTFRTSNTSFIRAVAIGSLLIIGLDAANRVEPAFASSPALQDGNDADQTRLVGDFLHYVLIAKPDLAEAAGRQLFESGITDAQLAELVSENDLGDKFDRSLSRGRGMAGVGPMVTEFEKRLEEGRLELARNQDRIQEAIGMLNGSLRAQMMGKRRLIEAGEYAVPQLLDVLVASKDPEVEIRVIEVIEEIKRQAVLPLCAALPELSATVQTKVCRMLSKIGWPTAMPYLLKVATSRQSTPEVKDAAMTAFRRLGGTSTDVSAAFTALGRKFFAQEQSLIAYPADPVNMVWNYGPHSGLVQTPVPTSIFCQVMAMRSARTALAADPSNRMALAVFVAADLRRENQIGAGETDPFAADAKYTPQFFATAAGSSIARDVLAMAIDGSDTALVRAAISALGMTVERGRMVGAGGRQPCWNVFATPTVASSTTLHWFSGPPCPRRPSLATTKWCHFWRTPSDRTTIALRSSWPPPTKIETVSPRCSATPDSPSWRAALVSMTSSPRSTDPMESTWWSFMPVRPMRSPPSVRSVTSPERAQRRSC